MPHKLTFKEKGHDWADEQGRIYKHNPKWTAIACSIVFLWYVYYYIIKKIGLATVLNKLL